MAISAENLAHLRELRNQLLDWLRKDALPLWEAHGVDWESGGYFETIAFDHARRRFESRGDVRRGRVVARQMFAFHAGRALGWQARRADPLQHGCDYLFAHMRGEDGHFHTAVDAKSRAPNGAFSLYEAAFYLFALAKIHGEVANTYPVYEAARSFLDLLRKGWGKANGGFDESRPPSLPLKANPHMHLLEAALAWIDATQAMPDAQPSWVRLAEELVDLGLGKFLDPRSGVVREFFDESWQPMADDRGRILEPGHQFEWAWLLLRWARGRHCPSGQRQACRLAARKLMTTAERFGVDTVRGVAINELWDDMTPKDGSAKLWPQAERVKAWCAVLHEGAEQHGSDAACQSLSKAVFGLQRYLAAEPAGLWQGVLFVDGTFSGEPSKASSLYHIVGAIETLDECVNQWT